MRNLQRCGVLALAAGLLLFAGAESRAALSVYLTLEGQEGPIEGSVTIEGREGTIEAIEIHHLVSVPIDPGTGLPTGRRKHEPFIFTKRIDKASPLLLKALANSETLPSAMFWYYRIDATGAEEHYYTVHLTNAMVVAVEPVSVNTYDPASTSFPDMERVRLIYERILHRWEPDQIEFEDSLEPPG